TAKPFLARWMQEQIGWRALLRQFKREAPRYAKLLPELPRLVHHNLTQGDTGLRRDLLAILKEQRQANRTLSAVLWILLGFIMGLVMAQLLLRLNVLGVL
ncbi:MAG: ubiquinone biosynthesis regulatory protein kinase UbiB, partial [Aquabacterium sp.]